MRLALLTFAALATLTFSPSLAEACSFGWADRALPDTNTPQVPANTRVWVLAIGECTPVLADSADNPIDVSVSFIETEAAQDLTVLTPLAPLEVGQGYQLKGCGGSDFVVTAPADHDPPSLPQISDVNVRSVDCGPNVEVHALASAVTLADLNQQADVLLDDPAGPSGSTHFAMFGDSGVTVDGKYEPDPSQLRLGTFDLAGNFSGWGPEKDMHAEVSCSLAAVPGSRGGAGWWLLPLGALLVLGRRRRSRPC